MARIIDVDRYRPLLHVLGGVMAVIVAIDLALRFGAGTSPPALLAVGVHNKDSHDRVAGRISAVLEHRPDRPLAIIVGSSSAREGLRTTILDAADPAHREWLNVAENGSASFDELRYTFGPLFASPVQADLVVLAVHPAWMAGRIFGDPTIDELMIGSKPSRSWLLYHRGWVAAVVRHALADVRERLLLGLGVAFPAIYPAIDNPWAETPVQSGVLDFDRRRGDFEIWRQKHWFDASWFDHVDDEVAAAADLIAGCRRSARRLVIVLMPESSLLRTTVPATAEAALRRAIARVSPRLEVFDLRAAIPDAGFNDHLHLNATGARRLSELLPSRLQ